MGQKPRVQRSKGPKTLQYWDKQVKARAWPSGQARALAKKCNSKKTCNKVQVYEPD